MHVVRMQAQFPYAASAPRTVGFDVPADRKRMDALGRALSISETVGRAVDDVRSRQDALPIMERLRVVQRRTDTDSVPGRDSAGHALPRVAVRKPGAVRLDQNDLWAPVDAGWVRRRRRASELHQGDHVPSVGEEASRLKQPMDADAARPIWIDCRRTGACIVRRGYGR
jgi:hypothetical protein